MANLQRCDAPCRAPGAPGRRRGRGGFFDSQFLAGAKSKLGIEKTTRSQKIPKGFNHSARRWPMKSDYAGSSRKTEINPERVESNWRGHGDATHSGLENVAGR